MPRPIHLLRSEIVQICAVATKHIAAVYLWTLHGKLDIFGQMEEIYAKRCGAYDS